MVNRSRKPKFVNLRHLLILALVAYFIFSIGNNLVYEKLYDLNLITKSEGITELYFTDHANLPNQYSSGENIFVNFTIHNLEHKNTTYIYKIEQVSENNDLATLYSSSEIIIPVGESRELTVPVDLIDGGDVSRLQVRLTFVDSNSYSPVEEIISYVFKKENSRG